MKAINLASVFFFCFIVMCFQVVIAAPLPQKTTGMNYANENIALAVERVGTLPPKSNAMFFNVAPKTSQNLTNKSGNNLSQGNSVPKDYSFPSNLKESDFLSQSNESACTTNIKKVVYRQSKAQNMNPYLILGVIDIESSCNPNAISEVGAKGLMQIMHSAELEYHNITGKPIRPQKFDVNYNVEVGTVYLKHLLRTYRNDLHAALVHYNAGGGPYRRAMSEGRRVVQSGYSHKVVNRWQTIAF